LIGLCAGEEISMGYDEERVMQEYTREIDIIMKATRADPADEQARRTVASALVYSLASAKKRTGRNPSVADADLYKLAEAIGEANNKKECVTAIKRAFPRRWSTILGKYDFDWKIPECKATLLAGKARNRRSTRIEAEVENLEKNVKELDRHLEELAEEVRKHEEQ
jgi:hypothetical protein